MLATYLIVSSVVAFFLYSLWRLIYNIYFHPLAKFPGPWWAGATAYSEAYYDILKGGRYFAEIEAMHARYGPIVRVAPQELSILDAEFYEQIYGGMNARRDLDGSFARLTGAPTSVISTTQHDHHRARRAPLLSFFSKQAITRLEPFIWDRVNLLVKKLKQAYKVGHVIELVDAYGAVTTDVISYYAYGKTFDFLGKDTNHEFKNDYMHAISGLSFVSPFMVHFPLASACMRQLPDWVLSKLSPGLNKVNLLRHWCAGHAMRVTQSTQPSIKEPQGKSNTIFDALMSESMPPEEKTLQRMTDESFAILGAGLETTARFLTNITTHLILNPDCLFKLKGELETAMPQPEDCPPCMYLENLPYLSAVVFEGLRHETVFANRFTRELIEPLPYKNYVIPPGTSIGCTPYLQNHNADVFPEPEKFRPERWIQARERGENLMKYLATFTKGGRMCLGINLAYAELFMTTAAMFRNFELELVDCGLESITMTRGYAFGFTENYDWGVRIRVTKVLE